MSNFELGEDHLYIQIIVHVLSTAKFYRLHCELVMSIILYVSSLPLLTSLITFNFFCNQYIHTFSSLPIGAFQ